MAPEAIALTDDRMAAVMGSGAPAPHLLTDDEMAKAMGIKPDQPVAPADQIPEISEANQNYTGIEMPTFGTPRLPERLLRENAPRIQQDVWNLAGMQPLAMEPLREKPLRPDLRIIAPGQYVW